MGYKARRWSQGADWHYFPTKKEALKVMGSRHIGKPFVIKKTSKKH